MAKLVATEQSWKESLSVSKQEVIERMCQPGLLPVFRTEDVRHLIPATKAFYDAGIGCIEYTMTMPRVLQLVEEAAACLPKDLFLGVGTVLEGRDVELAVAAGAKYIASPSLSPEMVEACNRHDVVSVVGAMTPTEIMTAMRLGADVIKVFPAAAVGPEFFAEVLGPFPGLHLMAASRTTLSHLEEYVQAGVEIVTFLANGLEAAAYAAGDCATITHTATKRVEAMRAARQGKAR
jgi:2-dehydro-3-deoxyphosphogluconate aldolase/(4S)-4-hydroxy-2-oxoglutarate aldolase